MQRNRSLDLAKGIAIVLMVIGHCYSRENFILQLIYAFHMPFFFIASGMLYAAKWIDSIQFKLQKSAKRLLIPYFVFETLFAALISFLSRSNRFPQVLADYFLMSILTGVGVSATWYLLCSFIVCPVRCALQIGSAQKCPNRDIGDTGILGSLCTHSQNYDSAVA